MPGCPVPRMGTASDCAEALLPDPRQAVALRRRRLRHPVAALPHAVELARLAIYGLAKDSAERRVLGDSRSTSLRSTRPTPASAAGNSRKSRRHGTAWSCWSACSRTSFRAPSTSPGRCARRRPGRHRRLPCLGQAEHVQGLQPTSTAPNHGRQAVRGRSRGPPRRRCCGTRPQARSNRCTIT